MTPTQPALSTAGTDEIREAEAPGPVQITYYTDPLCCWSWAFEPQWRRLQYAFGDQLVCTYRMAGMIAGWDDYEDPINAVSRPSQMGPIWVQAHHLSGMPIDARIWVDDPPASSYPACLAVKAAEQQARAAGARYLRRVREAVMRDARNVARREVLLALADELAADDRAADVAGPFDAARFRDDLNAPAAQAALREDLKEARYREIGRFPTLTLHRPGHAGRLIVGYRPYEALLETLRHVAPELQPVRPTPDADAYRAFWGTVTERELAEATGPAAAATG